VRLHSPPIAPGPEEPLQACLDDLRVASTLKEGQNNFLWGEIL